MQRRDAAGPAAQRPDNWRMPEMLRFKDEQGRIFLSADERPERIARRRRLLEALGPQPRDRVLDVGCGAGQLAAEIAERVGSAGWVEGIDVSEEMLAAARARWAGQDFGSWVRFSQADAARLPFPDGSFDRAISHQVYEYVEPIDAALRELRRVLRAGGHAVIVDADWDSVVWHTSDRSRMERVLSAWDEHLAHPYLPRELASKMLDAGFASAEIEAHALLERDAGHYMIDMVAGFVPGRRGVTPDEAQAWADEQRELGRQGRYFFSATQFWLRATA